MKRFLCTLLFSVMLLNAVVCLAESGGKTFTESINIENTIYGTYLRDSDEPNSFYVYGEIVNNNDVSVKINRVYYSILCDGKPIKYSYSSYITPGVISPHDKAYYYDIAYVYTDAPIVGEMTFTVVSQEIEVGSAIESYTKLPALATFDVEDKSFSAIVENNTNFWLSGIPPIVIILYKTNGTLAFVKDYSEDYTDADYMTPPGKSMYIHGVISDGYGNVKISNLPDIDYESLTVQAWGELHDADGDTELWNTRYNIKE